MKHTKHLDINTWLAKALCKDSTRYNLQYIYRAETELVSTDGNRMHIVTDLPKVAPHIVGVTHEETAYPDYSSVLPKTPQDLLVELAPVQAKLDYLKRLAVAGQVKKGHCFCRVEIANGSVTFSLSEDCAIQASVKIALPTCDKNASACFGVNLFYLIEAIEGVRDCTLGYRGELTGLEILGMIPLGNKARAIIMPMKLQ